MKYSRDNDYIILKVETGDSVIDAIRNMIEKEKISSGLILSGIGMISKARIGYLNGEKYVEMTFDEPREVVSFSGSIAENDPILHIHGSFADIHHNISGGHFFSGTGSPMMEISVKVLSKARIIRKKNEKSGLMELDFP